MKALTILAMVVCLCGTAWANLIVQTQPFGGIPELAGSLTFNQFDDSLYTLNSIKVLFYLQASGGELILDNDSHLPASGNFEFGAKGNISSTDVSLLDSSLLPIPGQVTAYNIQAFALDPNIGDVPGDYDPTPPDGLSYSGGTQDDTKSGFVGMIAWGGGTKGFIGTGTYDIDYSISQWLTYGGIGGIEYAVNPVTADGYVEVTYDYTIPEPATICLLGLGALSLIRRKK
jgi:hypothetical protein